MQSLLRHFSPSTEYITLKALKIKIVAFANSVDLDEVALSEPTLLALSSLNSQYDVAWMNYF